MQCDVNYWTGSVLESKLGRTFVKPSIKRMLQLTSVDNYIRNRMLLSFMLVKSFCGISHAKPQFNNFHPLWCLLLTKFSDCSFAFLKIYSCSSRNSLENSAIKSTLPQTWGKRSEFSKSSQLSRKWNFFFFLWRFPNLWNKKKLDDGYIIIQNICIQATTAFFISFCG